MSELRSGGWSEPGPVPRLPGSFTAAIFDLDGLLVDSEPLWVRAEADLLAAHGGSMTQEDVVATQGRSVDASVRAYASRLGMPESFRALRTELIDRVREMYATEIVLRPCAEDLIDRLLGRLPLAVASNSDRDLVELALTSTGQISFFQRVVSASDVGRAKPHPDVYLEACRRLGVEPRAAIGFEDSATGIAALSAAGLTSVWVGSGSIQSGPARADFVVDTLCAVLGWIDE